MKQIFTILAFSLFVSSAFSQITFEKGYVINNSGARNPVMIKYIDWKNNPSEITFKTSEDDAPQTLSVKEISEFGVDGEASYVRATVPIDKSDQNLNNLSNNGRFEFNDQTVFLKMLVDGKADLLQYTGQGVEQFFFRKEDGEVEALIYKRYIPEFTIKIAENNQYQQQLFNSLTCENLTQNDFEKTDYSKKDLVKLFSNYNDCQNSESTNFTERVKRDAFNLSIRPGVNFSSLVMNTYVVRRTMDFGDKTSFRLGLEGEYILPFFRNKWGFIVEPTYQSYEGDAVFPEEKFEDGMVTVKYQSLEIPFGVRHYFFINENNKIFLNATYTVDLVMGDSYFDYETTADYNDTEIDTNTGTNFSLGGGYNYKKFSLEARYNFDRALTGKQLNVGTAYKTFSLILGYNFL